MQSKLGKMFFGTANKPGDGHSPFALYAEDIENKRSRLFPDRKRVPGRKTKFIVAIVYLIHLYTYSEITLAKKQYDAKAEQQRQMSRKIAPFFQSIEDINFTIAKHRRDLIMIEAFKSQGGAKYLQKFNRFTHHDIWIPNYNGEDHVDWQKQGTRRMAESIDNYKYGRVLTGYNIQNI